MKNLFSYGLLFLSLLVIGCNNSNKKNAEKVIKPKIIKWMSNNLNTCTFRNGDTIPEAKNIKDWETLYEEHKPAWCYYNNDVQNAHLGKIYNWYAVIDARVLAPKGWHIPSRSEWLDKKLNPKENNKIYDLKLLGGGITTGGEFIHLGDFGYWWTSTEQNSTDSWIHFLREDGWEGEDYGLKTSGNYVLCVSN